MKAPNFTLSILKNNRLFSAALFFIYTLVMALLVMLSFLSESIDQTFGSYLEDYGYQDAYVVTAGTPAQLSASIEAVDGVDAVWGCLSADASTELPGGRTLSLRYIGTGSGDFSRYYDVDTGEKLAADEDTIAVYYYFAQANGIEPGDVLRVTTALGTRELTVTNIVSCPETIAVGRDSSSWFDPEDFANIYIPEDTLEEMLGVPGYVNLFRLRFEASADPRETLDRVLETKGLGAVSSSIYEDSAVKKQLDASVDGTKAVITYIPAFIILMGVMFSTLFIGQIIRKSNHNIALLRALGYSNGKISGIYVRYSLILSTVSAAAGTALGFLLLWQLLKIYQGFYALPAVRYAGRWWNILLLLLVIQGIGAVSCLISSRGIGRVDPAIMFGRGKNGGGQTIPKWLEGIRTDAYTRIALYASYRSRKRSAVTVLCYTACFILTFLSVSVLFTKSAAVSYVFTERYDYDLAAVYSAPEAAEQIAGLSCVESSEERIMFSTAYEDEALRFEALPEGSITDVMDTRGNAIAIPESGVILEEGFARRHDLQVGSSFTVDGVELTVAAISREYLCSTQYISFAQAERFGYAGSNALAIRLAAGSDTTAFTEAASAIEGYSYLIDVGHREACASYALRQLDMPCYIFIVFAFIIGMVILCNMNQITLSERKREFATLRILGAQPRRFLKMSLIENALQYVMTCVLGIACSIPVSRFLLQAMSTQAEEYVLESPIPVSLITCGVLILYILLGVAFAQKYILRMNCVQALGDKE